LQAILDDNSGVDVTKRRGARVLRASVTKNSRLVGRTAVDAKFRENYNAAILAVQQGGKNVVQPLSSLTFGAGDILVLQVSDDCLLLSPPTTRGSSSRKSFGSSLANLTNFSRADSMEGLDVEVSK
jgi:di/tricarboxylate transporter